MKAPADPEIRELVMILSDFAEQNLEKEANIKGLKGRRRGYVWT